jgi:hypothetical protein
MVEILSGLKDGEQVVVGGLERMAEGIPVAPQPVESDSGDAPTPAGSSVTP